MTSHPSLFTPANLGAIPIRNRILMAPMTRSRANVDGSANDLMREYYAQRAAAGVIISEGTQPSENGQGYCRTPGMHNIEQVQAWKNVTDGVVEKGGNMVLQIMHCGRVASAHNKQANAETVAPSAIQARGQIYADPQGMVDFDQPKALSLSGISDVIDEYTQAAVKALKAGFAGVELHATSGYLPAQFLSTGTNQRTDDYGGNVENRVRFVVDVLDAMSEAIGPEHVGIRICPGNPFNDLHDENPAETFATLLQTIDKMGLAYLHVIRMAEKITGVNTVALARENFSGPLVLNDSYDFAEAEHLVSSGQAAGISFARHFIANPDLPALIESGRELQAFNPKTLYTQGAEGYTDYL